LNLLPVPPEYVPQGGILLSHGHAYQDAYEIGVEMLPGAPTTEDGGERPRIAVVRQNELYEANPEEVRTMAGNGWRFWVRWSLVQGNIRIAKVEPLIEVARPWPFLDSDHKGGRPR
jgi:hypothetical protein